VLFEDRNAQTFTTLVLCLAVAPALVLAALAVERVNDSGDSLLYRGRALADPVFACALAVAHVYYPPKAEENENQETDYHWLPHLYECTLLSFSFVAYAGSFIVSHKHSFASWLCVCSIAVFVCFCAHLAARHYDHRHLHTQFVLQDVDIFASVLATILIAATLEVMVFSS
jgi:hypothetical protein